MSTIMASWHSFCGQRDDLPRAISDYGVTAPSVNHGT